MTPKPKMPRTLKIGAHDYTVHRPNAPELDGQALNGLCEEEELRITVRRGLKRSKAAEIALHEALHALAAGTDVPIEMEEKLVGLIAPRLLSLIRDNPQLMDYLTK